MHNEHIDQIKDIKVSFEVDRGYIAVKQDGETNGPDARSVPPMAQPIFHQGKAAGFISKLLYEMLAI